MQSSTADHPMTGTWRQRGVIYQIWVVGASACGRMKV
jgi:hypothetical protein